jgi:hypothetical protein
MSNWFRNRRVLASIGLLALVSLLPSVTANPQQVTVSPKLNYTVVCTSNASPAVCSADAAGFVALPSTGTTLTVKTTAVTAKSQIFLQFDATLGTALGVTCDNTPSGVYWVNMRSTSGTVGFTVKTAAAPTNNSCFSYLIVN